MEDPPNRRVETRPDNALVIDNVLTTQPELGPTVPEGGYGWVVLLASLFFHALIPSLLVSFGIFLAFDRMERDTLTGKDPRLWDNTLLHVPLFFIGGWTFFDSTARNLISQSTWPKLVATAGTCLTCAGLLFVWIGMTGTARSSLFIVAGLISGIGASIQMAQCEILIAQYFRLKLPVLRHVTQVVAGVGFIVAPIVIGHHIFTNSLMQIILWYQAIILQGLVVNLLFRKPTYLKSAVPSRYNYVTSHPDDEEDIFSKNNRELQIKAQNPNGDKPESAENPSESASSSQNPEGTTEGKETSPGKHWVTFEEDYDDDEEVSKYDRVQQWEVFDDEDIVTSKRQETQVDKRERGRWEKFDDEAKPDQPRNQKNLRLEMAFDVEPAAEGPSTMSVNGVPIPLFSDTPVNHNTTYSYDLLEDPARSSVFQSQPQPVESFSRSAADVLRRPTFYKSLFTVITTKWSFFVFFAVFPSYMYQEVLDLKMRALSNFVGTISTATVLFSSFSYWLNLEKRWRAKMMMMLTWMGALGYLMIADYATDFLLLFGAVQVVVSLAALQHVGEPLLGLTVKGESTKEYTLISKLSGLSFLIFVALDISVKNVFRNMGFLHFLNGFLWLSNYIYKRLRRILT
ncbi:hypothetical protein GWI33_013624 [Rhynchophorus ferrugineus]|uniref:Uncharacterized protein n=1 Tax=Rhynchophorus ferrugineus TaxID=354439 RepID=A0A834I308_RHYFE|nr:hypothetical protein GWI33_013624 [Rhynchophorus ferrugineus]